MPSRCSASSRMSPSSPRRVSSSIASPRSDSALAAPRIEASGVRKSWETDASRVLRTRSASMVARAASPASASAVRCKAAAVCSTRLSSRPRSSAGSAVPGGNATPMAPPARSPERSGRNSQGVSGRVPVPAPAGSRRSMAQRAAASERSSSVSGGQAASRSGAPSAPQHHGGPADGPVDLGGGDLGHRLPARHSREPAGELEETACGADAGGGGAGLLARPPGHRRRDHGDDEEDDEREQFVGLRDGEGVDRLDEEEIVGEERQAGREHRRPDAEQDGGRQDRHQVDHREVRQRDDGGQHLSERRGHRHAERCDDVGPRFGWRLRQANPPDRRGRERRSAHGPKCRPRAGSAPGAATGAGAAPRGRRRKAPPRSA